MHQDTERKLHKGGIGSWLLYRRVVDVIDGEFLYI